MSARFHSANKFQKIHENLEAVVDKGTIAGVKTPAQGDWVIQQAIEVRNFGQHFFSPEYTLKKYF